MTRLFAGTPFDIPPRCDDCGELESECLCTPEQKDAAERERQLAAERIAPDQQTARISIQKRKGNRRVTVVEGLTSRANDLPGLLADLQTRCGTGGTVKAKEDTIELQGAHLDPARERLREIGYRVKG